MKEQQGQSMVEFALIAPIVFLMIFGMIWGGIMFMEYMHYSNAVRTAARQIAVMADDTERESMRANQEKWLKELWQQEVAVTFYEPNPVVTIEENYAPEDTEHKNLLSRDVVVTVGFARAKNIPVILDAVDFPPKYIKLIKYRMRVEEAASDDTDDEEEDEEDNDDNNSSTDEGSDTGGGSGGLGEGIASAISGG